jgi:hypothetical protein
MLHWSVGVLSGSFGPEARVTINVPASQRWYQPSEPGAITTPTLLDAVEATSTTVTATHREFAPRPVRIARAEPPEIVPPVRTTRV